ncbi:Activin receptor type-2B [Brachionus plicatilis]|uniref:receptor protein serine/threonine kinase n=1 Tax=Brachionus plicatilis TaxID=10195 RepID=A0A3M7S712_BRAPC|nr:Activin receptor type-2B [Brachionus plicatilis]
MDQKVKPKLKCLHRKSNCDDNKCFSEEECTQSGMNKHCYSMFKIPEENRTVQQDDIVIAGCWSGEVECDPPYKIKQKYQSELYVNISSIIPEFLLGPEMQNKCITYAMTHDSTSYRSKNNVTFCCCSTSMCNSDILVTNEKSPYQVISQMIKRRTNAEIFTTKATKLSTNININTVLITSLILMSLLFLMLLISKSELPNIIFNHNATNGQNGTQSMPSSVQIPPNSNLMKDYLKQNQPENGEIRQLTQPLLNPTNETLFIHNIVPPNLGVLPDSILKSNAVISFQSVPKNVEIAKRNDLDELESFKARLEEQLAKSSKSSSIDQIDPNMIVLPSPIKPSDIFLIEKVSQGQFSSVWKGRCLNNKQDCGEVPEYGIKIFSHMQKSSWSNEKEIYHALATINPFILTHFSSDLNELPKSNTNPNLMFSSNEYWIITEYHSNGSLCDFLRINFLSWHQMVRVVHSILEGLAYLHSESIDPKKQFAIAHRDLKSKNILVKKDGQTCCIADFGLALRLNNHNKLNSAEIRSKVGTRRYMSPELIEGAIAFTKETFLTPGIDVYACALVLWEIISRGDFYGEKCEYKLPFEDEVGQNPSLEDMKEIVVDKSFRPIIKENWLNYHKISSIAQTIEECWDIDLDARISSECAASRIRKIYNELD